MKKGGLVVMTSPPFFVIPLGFEPKTHSLEGCCSNPTELRDLQIECKGNVFFLNDQNCLDFYAKKMLMGCPWVMNSTVLRS